MRAWTLALLTLAACASELPKSRTQPNVTTGPTASKSTTVSNIERPLFVDLGIAVGDARPQVRASVEMDAAAIPLGKWGPALAGSAFRMSTNPPEFHIEGSRFAEVSVGTFSAFTDTIVPTPSWPECHRPGSAMALWRGVSTDDWSDDSIKVVMTRGPFDYATCTAAPQATLVKRAVAIVPGFVYALRVDDSVYVVLPHATLASATRNAAGSGPFSSATLLCTPHHQAAAAMRIAPSSFRSWQEIATYGPWADPSRQDGEDPRTHLLVIVEVRARGEGNVVSVSAAIPPSAIEDAFAPFLAAMRRAGQSQ